MMMLLMAMMAVAEVFMMVVALGAPNPSRLCHRGPTIVNRIELRAGPPVNVFASRSASAINSEFPRQPGGGDPSGSVVGVRA
jgi:hypothetical protein